MGKRYDKLSEEHTAFIAQQKIFFVGTATADSRVNISPKGMNAFRILNDHRASWLNVTGSGNETAAHVQHSPRMTIMFCAFEGAPRILRLYGAAKVIHKHDPEWQSLFSMFEPLPGARQIFDLAIDLVQTSCGMGVPYYAYQGDRELLKNWAVKQGEKGLRQYWKEKNQISIDRIPTNIIKGT
ncbi:MAG: pyridoxamine 5'-phosphate oxidase family protein [Burkholderiales bacterium]